MLTMRRPMLSGPFWVLASVLLSQATWTVEMVKADGSLAQEILSEAGIEGGIVVHLGSESNELTLGLCPHDGFLVHALTPDATRVANLRAEIDTAERTNSVSAELWKSDRLPYVDNLINLLVVEPQCDVPQQELMRVLVPEGTLCLRSAEGVIMRTKPRPETMDHWTHFLHDAGNNAVAEDLLVGPPRSLQWCAPPLWLRSHETPSGIQSPVSAGGRLYYFLDEGPIGITDERLPDYWSLVCRDAFNGKLLWKRQLDRWGWRSWSHDKYAGKDWLKLRAGRTDVPAENQRRIVAQQDRIYVTLSHQAPLSILDAANGKTLHTVPDTDSTREILVSGNVVLAYVQADESDPARRRGQQQAQSARLVAADANTGKGLWQHPCAPIRSLQVAVDGNRVVYCTGQELIGLETDTGQQKWKTPLPQANPRTLVVVDGVAVASAPKHLTAFETSDGTQLWHHQVPPISGAEGEDLFVIDGTVWRGMQTVDESAKAARKTPHVLGTGWELRTGDEKKQVFVKNLRSPEHHHRCYRNKATSRFIISSLEGAEFLDLEGEGHSQENWLRGSCRSGMMPCNGLLYVPPDQCFCEPGAKLLGYAAVAAQRTTPPAAPVPDHQRLERGPAYESPLSDITAAPADWPTLRYDPARHGSTPAEVPAQLARRWQVTLGGALTAPVMAQGRIYVAQKDAHRVHALDADTGERLWQFTANGRIDSPPTIAHGRVVFGSCDGYVYCLRAEDGELVWRFMAAPREQRIAYFDQLESSWPVHGSVLIEQGLVYFSAGRSTYLDGGIHVYAVDLRSGTMRHQTVLEGPFPNIPDERDVSFYVLGANSDVLVSEGGSIYMRQKKLTSDLKEIAGEVLSSKGAQDVGLHVFSTAGLLDGSWYNRTFWMYSQRWPGFQLANQAPKSGQLLVVDDQRTYALRVFYHRNVHSPMFFPGQQGYLLFADDNSNEPQIVGEPGSVDPIEWLPQSDYSRGRGDEIRELNSPAFGLDKMIGYTRAKPAIWNHWLPVRVRAMVKAGEILFAAGAPDEFDPDDPMAALQGRRGAQLVSIVAQDGQVLHQTTLDAVPVFDGLIAAQNHLFMATTDGRIICLGGQ